MSLDWTVMIGELRTASALEERLTRLLDSDAAGAAGRARRRQATAERVLRECLAHYEDLRG